MKSLAGAMPDVVVVGGIGAGAVNGLRHGGIRVFQSPGGTVADALALLQSGDLKEIVGQGTCAGHSEGGGCAHPHGH
jgi:predicted Fe-Mo cluster-binding NifX family protein